MLKSNKKFLAVFLVFLFLSSIALCFLFEVGNYKKHIKYVEKYAQVYTVETSLVLSVIRTESGFKENAVSKKGAVGLMQIMPNTASFIAKKIGVSSYNLFDPETNIIFGVYYLSYLNLKFNNEIYVISAYNAGEGRVEDWIKSENYFNKLSEYKETKTYLKRVLRRKNLYKKLLKY